MKLIFQKQLLGMYEQKQFWHKRASCSMYSVPSITINCPGSVTISTPLGAGAKTAEHAKQLGEK